MRGRGLNPTSRVEPRRVRVYSQRVRPCGSTIACEGTRRGSWTRVCRSSSGSPAGPASLLLLPMGLPAGFLRASQQYRIGNCRPIAASPLRVGSLGFAGCEYEGGVGWGREWGGMGSGTGGMGGRDSVAGTRAGRCGSRVDPLRVRVYLRRIRPSGPWIACEGTRCGSQTRVGKSGAFWREFWLARPILHFRCTLQHLCFCESFSSLDRFCHFWHTLQHFPG